jgi:hypothetical protein
MGYKVFERKIIRTGNPTLSIGKLGRFGLNAFSAKYFRDTAVEFVLLLWDEETRRLALRPTSKKDGKAFTLKYDKQGRGAGAGFFAKSFLEYINYDYSTTRTLPAEWNENQGILEVQIPDEAFRAEKESKVFTLTASKQAAAKARAN